VSGGILLVGVYPMKTGLSTFALTGKKALVTGGASGIGRACAIGMARAGADVAIVDLNEEAGRDAAAEVERAGGKSLFVRCDVTDPGQVADMVGQVATRFGRLDIAMNNAGAGATGGPTVGDSAISTWRKVIDMFLHSVFFCCREEAKIMIPQKYGRIINTSSMEGTIVSNMSAEMDVGFVGYCTAKAGVKHLTKALAMEWVQHDIRVNSISPGYIETQMTRKVQEFPEMFQHLCRTTPMNRFGKAEEMVGGVIYLASDASSYTTGFDLVMDGGHSVW
jgi:NAD(P)-dependent dehydrogenase (short-subunit alcohol dehydrogenase family)